MTGLQISIKQKQISKCCLCKVQSVIVVDGRQFGHVNVACNVNVNVHMSAGKGKRGQWRLIKGTKNGTVNSEHGASRAEVCSFVQRGIIPNKKVIF